MTNSLKGVLIEYRNATTKEEKEDVLFKVYDTKVIMDRHNPGINNFETLVVIKIKELRDIVDNIKYRSNDLKSYILEEINYLFENGNLDLSREDYSINKWFRVSLNGRVKNRIIKHNKTAGLDISENGTKYDTEMNEEQYSNYDEVAYKRFMEVDNGISHFNEFITSIGGLNKLLSDEQKEVYWRLSAGLTQEEIADELECSQQNVSKLFTAAKKRIKKEYTTFQAFRIMKKQPDTKMKISTFLNNFDDLLVVDSQKSFDYYNYTLNFLKKEYVNYRIEDDYSYTVLDVFFDDLNQNEHSLINKILHNYSNEFINKREREKLVKITLRAFHRYVKTTDKALEYTIHNVIDYYSSDEYNKFLHTVS